MEGAPLSRYDNRDLWSREEVRNEYGEKRDERREKRRREDETERGCPFKTEK